MENQFLSGVKKRKLLSETFAVYRTSNRRFERMCEKGVNFSEKRARARERHAPPPRALTRTVVEHRHARDANGAAIDSREAHDLSPRQRGVASAAAAAARLLSRRASAAHASVASAVHARLIPQAFR